MLSVSHTTRVLAHPQFYGNSSHNIRANELAVPMSKRGVNTTLVEEAPHDQTAVDHRLLYHA